MQVIRQGNLYAEIDRHTNGRMYGGVAATPYDRFKVPDRNKDMVRAAKPESFMVQYCIVHAFNYLFGYSILVDRKQVFQLAVSRSKNTKQYTAECKIKAGYAPEMFEHFWELQLCN